MSEIWPKDYAAEMMAGIVIKPRGALGAIGFRRHKKPPSVGGAALGHGADGDDAGARGT